jgi:dihydrofolate reductase
VISIVVALSSNRVIGRDGALPWRLPTDLRRFRELTTGQTVIMGRRTYESLPTRWRPLPDRRNLVLSSRPFHAAGAEVFGDFNAALDACAHDCFVIGGGLTYTQAMPLAERVYATHVEREVDGDTRFPELSPAEWHRVAHSDPIAENDETFRFAVYERSR